MSFGLIVNMMILQNKMIFTILIYWNSSRDTYRELDSFTIFYTANCNVTVAVTYLELDNVTLTSNAQVADQFSPKLGLSKNR